MTADRPTAGAVTWDQVPVRRPAVDPSRRRRRHAVTSVVMVPLWVIAVLVPWALRPVLGIRPAVSTWTAGESTRWHERRRRLTRPSRPWLSPGASEPSSLRERWQPRIVAGLVLILAAFAWWPTSTTPPSERRAYNLTQPSGVDTVSSKVPAAFADSPWYPEYLRDLNYGAAWLGGIQLVDGIQFPDARSKYLNVRNGYRESWTPPACTCHRLTVWVYGASTVFGLGQRDDHTIPSELARVAWKHGIALDVVNKGIPGEEHWQEANRLRWDLTRHDAPDLVVFYDGASDIVGASWLNEQRLPDVAQPVEPLTEQFLAAPELQDAITEAKTGGATQPPKPEGMWEAPKTTVPERTPAEVGRLAAARYGRSLTLSKDLVAIHDLEARWYWQPTRLSRGKVKGEPTTKFDAASSATATAARAALPTGVVDLSDVLDGNDQPIFSDDVHHNELGARLIAESIYRDLAPRLERLAGSKAGG